MSLICKEIQEINEYVKVGSTRVTEFLNAKLASKLAPIFTSTDIRNAGFKIAPVDTNLFPSGFNNLSVSGRQLMVDRLKTYLKSNFPGAVKILIFPENFTRNLKYLENLEVLLSIFKSAGLNANIGTNLDYKPDLIVLNNDLTNGLPEELQGCDVPIIPDVDLGWHLRRKSRHFLSYNQLVKEFCSLNNFDPWLLSTEFENCEGVDFRNKVGLESLAQSVDNVLKHVKEKYLQYGIKEAPFVFVKADQGTYGMGVMVARAADDIITINKKNRHSMQLIKQGVQNTSIIVQEGVPTIECYNDAPAESLAYLCGAEPIEIFSRSHAERDPYSSLNTPGMNFSSQKDELHPIKNLVARMTSIASAFELDFYH